MPIGRSDLKPIILAALTSYGGKASVTDIARYIWSNHEAALRASGDFFFVWQYDMRRAAESLRNSGDLKRWDRHQKVWELA
jgi:transposase-like protein